MPQEDASVAESSFVTMGDGRDVSLQDLLTGRVNRDGLSPEDAAKIDKEIWEESTHTGASARPTQ